MTEIFGVPAQALFGQLLIGIKARSMRRIEADRGLRPMCSISPVYRGRTQRGRCRRGLAVVGDRRKRLVSADPRTSVSRSEFRAAQYGLHLCTFRERQACVKDQACIEIERLPAMYIN